MIDTTVALGAYGIWTDYATHPGHDGAGYPSQVCQFAISGITAMPKDVRAANARLISASPEMFSVCRGVLSALGYPRGSEAQVRCLEEIGGDARAAVQKAKGCAP